MVIKLILIGSILFVLVTIPVALFLVKQNQDNRQSAQVTTPSPSTCAPIQSPASVTVDYPGCTGIQCDFTQASCEWDAVGGATSYNISVSQVEDGSIVKDNESIPSSITKVLFPIIQNKTYKCDVVAVSTCGSISTAVSDQLLCEADALLTTPTPTAPTQPTPTFTPTPTGTLTPTPTPIPPTPTPIPPTPTATFTPSPTQPPIYLPTATPTATPTIKQPGGIVETVGIMGLVVLIVVGGIVLLVL